ncbi:hypothetical protein ACWEPM_34630 [Streptomyces sp. NPDC004244]
MTQFGSVLLVAQTSGSLAAAGIVDGVLCAGQVLCGPLLGRLTALGAHPALALGLAAALTTRVPAVRGHSADRAFIPARQTAPPEAVAARAEAPREAAPRSV